MLCDTYSKLMLVYFKCRGVSILLRGCDTRSLVWPQTGDLGWVEPLYLQPLRSLASLRHIVIHWISLDLNKYLPAYFFFFFSVETRLGKRTFLCFNQWFYFDDLKHHKPLGPTVTVKAKCFLQELNFEFSIKCTHYCLKWC